MDTDETKAGTSGPGTYHDEVDFTSGYETQYRKEYSPLKPIYVPPPDKKHAWFRNWSTILMISFLSGVFILGTVMLVVQVFTASPLQIFMIVAIYVAIAAVMIWLEVQSIKVR
ncbi:uncharacterized protein LOC6529421 [Drosophila yakuba]|uniref:Uncharacterized protein n=1 Tax=Drosophila yakuba TaxID=7245 RepID=B4P8M9_DROYA|nr:uncharacterized protein LOC6529421 [Drosophila yakuba]XP_039484701.1 uncharacterized protein LOC120447239 [Drosophila santomea]EDW90137.1 uncharacterized protein Dyak_GE12813 [Drosophila yakuba]